MKKRINGLLTLLLVLVTQFTFAQDMNISGVVSDSNGLPVPGANVKVKGSSTGTSTDFDGTYKIKARSTDVLVYSYQGMNSLELKVSGVKMNARLSERSTELEGVVVTSFNIKKRKDAIISSTQVVGAKELGQASSPNIVQSLTGKVSGLQINNTAGGVNGTSRVVLRGPRSVSGNNEALVVIDGAISTLDVLTQLPTDLVESLAVLKGQQGGALYGEQGSNGVIIVTTKKGNKGKLTVNFNTSVDIQSIAFSPQVQTKYGQGWYGYDTDFPNINDPRNGSEHFSYFENGSWGEPFDTGAFAGTIVPVGLPQADGSFLTDVYKSRGSNNFRDFYKQGMILQNNLTINSGNEDGYALLSLNRQTTDFVVEGDQLKRNSFTFKAGKKLGKFNIDAAVNYINSITSQTDKDLLGELIQTPTNININRFRNSGHSGHWTAFARNPFTLINQVRNDDSTDLFVTNLIMNYEINKNITLNYTGNLRANYGIGTTHDDGYKLADYQYDLTNAPYVDNDNGLDPTYGVYSGGGNGASSYFINQSFRRNLYSDIIASFNYNFTKDINFKANAGFVIQDSKFRITTQGGNKLDVPGFYHITNVLSPSTPGILDNREVNRRQYGTLVNIDLGYKDYLFLNGGLRTDRTSTVTKGFPFNTIGAAFILTKAFPSLGSGILNYAKLTASATKVGNSTPVEAYRTNDTGVVAPGFPFGNLVGYNLNVDTANPNIRPETVNTNEIGLNLGFFKDRLTVDLSAYVTNTRDMITAAITPASAGLNSLLDNTGLIENKGYEIDLGITPIKIQNGLEWNMRVNYSTYKSIVKELAPGINQIALQQLARDGAGIFAEVGEEFPLIKGTSFVRNDAGNIIVNADGNPTKTSNFVKLGKGNPDFIVGLSNTFTYKGFSLIGVADFRTGHSIYSETYRNLQFTGGAIESAEQDRFAGYVVPGSVQLVGGQYVPNTVPAGSQSSIHGLNGQVNDFFNNVMRQTGETNIIDATALRVREISLSYALPTKLIQNSGVEAVKFSINARNPFNFFFTRGAAGTFYKNGIYGKKNLGYTDPEASNASSVNANSNGVGFSEVGQYPSLRTLGFSLNITF